MSMNMFIIMIMNMNKDMNTDGDKTGDSHRQKHGQGDGYWKQTRTGTGDRDRERDSDTNKEIDRKLTGAGTGVGAGKGTGAGAGKGTGPGTETWHSVYYFLFLWGSSHVLPKKIYQIYIFHRRFSAKSAAAIWVFWSMRGWYDKNVWFLNLKPIGVSGKRFESSRKLAKTSLICSVFYL